MKRQYMILLLAAVLSVAFSTPVPDDKEDKKEAELPCKIDLIKDVACNAICYGKIFDGNKGGTCVDGKCVCTKDKKKDDKKDEKHDKKDVKDDDKKDKKEDDKDGKLKDY